MKLLSKLFGRTPNLKPLFKELKPELAKRFGSSEKLYRGQIDRVVEEIKLREKLIPYAYIAFLNDDDYTALTAEHPEKWKEKEVEFDEFIQSQPRTLGRGNFYESHAAIGTISHD